MGISNFLLLRVTEER